MYGMVNKSVRGLVLGDAAEFTRRARRAAIADTTPPADATPALRHVLRIAGEVDEASRYLRRRLEAAPAPSGFPKSPLGRQLANAAHLLDAGVTPAVMKVQLKGFDTHAGQVGRHPRLLKQLAMGLGALRSHLRASGRWNDVLVMTYAEFGRRVRENGSNGTDHGKAAPHFLLGGRIRGGLYGAPPSLTELAGDDLRHTTDFRRLYATASRFWGASAGKYQALACV